MYAKKDFLKEAQKISEFFKNILLSGRIMLWASASVGKAGGKINVRTF